MVVSTTPNINNVACVLSEVIKMATNQVSLQIPEYIFDSLRNAVIKTTTLEQMTDLIWEQLKRTPISKLMPEDVIAVAKPIGKFLYSSSDGDLEINVFTFDSQPSDFNTRYNKIPRYLVGSSEERDALIARIPKQGIVPKREMFLVQNQYWWFEGHRTLFYGFDSAYRLSQDVEGQRFANILKNLPIELTTQFNEYGKFFETQCAPTFLPLFFEPYRVKEVKRKITDYQELKEFEKQNEVVHTQCLLTSHWEDRHKQVLEKLGFKMKEN